MGLGKPLFDTSVKTDQGEVTVEPDSFSTYLKKLVIKSTGLAEGTYDEWVGVGQSTLDSFTKSGTLEAISIGLGKLVGGPTGAVLGTAVDVAGRIYQSTIGEKTVGEVGA